MEPFSSEQVPVISPLARNFAVSDAWFSPVPSDTWLKRSFFHSGTSNSHVVNGAISTCSRSDVEPLINEVVGRFERVALYVSKKDRALDQTHRESKWVSPYTRRNGQHRRESREYRLCCSLKLCQDQDHTRRPSGADLPSRSPDEQFGLKRPARCTQLVEWLQAIFKSPKWRTLQLASLHVRITTTSHLWSIRPVTSG